MTKVATRASVSIELQRFQQMTIIATGASFSTDLYLRCQGYQQMTKMATRASFFIELQRLPADDINGD